MATPAVAALDVPLIDANGDAVGLATFTENADGVTVHLLIEGLSPGEHGWHLHEFGVCDPNGDEPFSSAGGHWNPTNQPHGAPDADEHHVGDFGNLVASADGLAEVEITTTDFTFEAGPNSVFDEDGTSIVVHEGTDDLTDSAVRQQRPSLCLRRRCRADDGYDGDAGRDPDGHADDHGDPDDDGDTR